MLGKNIELALFSTSKNIHSSLIWPFKAFIGKLHVIKVLALFFGQMTSPAGLLFSNINNDHKKWH